MKALLPLAVTKKYPPALFGLRLAAQLSSALLLVFGGFLLVLLPAWLILLYGLLLILFGIANLAALYRINKLPSNIQPWLNLAHICNLLLPAAYVLGSWGVGMGFSSASLLTITAPALLNEFALAQSGHFHSVKD